MVVMVAVVLRLVLLLLLIVIVVIRLSRVAVIRIRDIIAISVVINWLEIAAHSSSRQHDVRRASIATGTCISVVQRRNARMMVVI